MVEEDSAEEDPENLKALEDIAHAEEALISSDALRFVRDHAPAQKQVELLRHLIERGRSYFPHEDGWLILNLDRIQSLYDGDYTKVGETDQIPDPDVVPSGSLAEAILAGDTKSALALIDHRPMVALAAAAADLDSLYRMRIGGTEQVTTEASELLKQQVHELDTSTLQTVILALTSALDGTYTDEQSAVKMAILKAINTLE